MSDYAAIAAVTTSLRDLLLTGLRSTNGSDAEVSGTEVTTRPPDKARSATANNNQLNLFLYSTQVDPSWRNTDVPGRAMSGETVPPVLPLNLFYALTVYSRDSDDLLAHRIMGRAMSVFHDNPVLGPSQLSTLIPTLGHAGQMDRVRVTPHPTSLDEMLRWWSAFQTQYRLSTTYQVSTVLIESSRSAVTPLPVLRRGPGDAGVVVQTNLLSSSPALTSIEFVAGESTAILDEILTIHGHNLGADSVSVLMRHQALRIEHALAPEPGSSASEVGARIPRAPDSWPAGLYGLTLRLQTGEAVRETNTLAFALVPEITFPAPIPDPSGNFAISVSPQVFPGQRVALLFGDEEFAAPDRAAVTGSVVFVVPPRGSGSYYVRLRVDGVDSRLIIHHGDGTPLFNPARMVTIP